MILGRFSRWIRILILIRYLGKIQDMTLRNDVIAAVLIVSTVILFVTENLFHYPIAVMSILGCIQMAEQKVFDQSLKYLCWIFFAVWLPMVLACFGSSNPLHSCKTTIAYLHFLPMGFYISVSCLQERVRVMVGRAIIFLCFVLVLDACFQFFSGHNLLGYPLQGNSVTGMFHPKQRLGLFLAILAPFFIHFLWKRGWSLILILMSALPYLFVVLVSLKRNSWLMLFFGLIIFAFIECKGSIGKFSRIVGVASFVILLVMSGLFISVPTFTKQMEHSYGLLSGNVQEMDRSSNHRLALWDVGLKMVQDNPIMGIGPRGYRYDFKKYAEPENFWVKNFDSGQTHPHLMSLEILVETGIIGFSMYLFVLVLLLKIAINSVSSDSAKFWLIAAFLAWLPLNTHLAFYGSYWASVAWIFLALGLRGAQSEVGHPK